MSKRPDHLAPDSSLVDLEDFDWRGVLAAGERQLEMELRLAERARRDLGAFLQLVLRRERFPKAEIEAAVRAGRTLDYRITLADIQLEMLDFLMEHDRVVIRAAPEVGKSSLITIGTTLWLAGQDLRGFTSKISSLNSGFASAFTRMIATYVETSRALHQVFPEMRPGLKWTESELYLERPADSVVKDPHWLAVGAEGPQQGKRVDLDVGDDMQDMKSTSTEYLSDKTLKWWREGESRMLSGGKRWVICNALEPYDMGHKLVKEDGYKLFMLKARDKRGKTVLPVIWPQWRVDAYPEAMKARHLDCDASTDKDRQFKDAFIRRCSRHGNGLTSMQSTRSLLLPSGARMFIGVDLMHGKHNVAKPLRGRIKKTDDTVFINVLAALRQVYGNLWPFIADRLPQVKAELLMPLCVERGKMTAPEVKGRIYDWHERFPQATFVVEDVGAQDYIRQDLQIEAPEIKIIPFHTGAYKHDSTDGVIGINTEMSEGLHIFPCEEDEQINDFVYEVEMARLVQEMRDYTRGSHTGDTLAAYFFARNVARRLKGSEMRVVGIPMGTAGRTENLIQGEDAQVMAAPPWMSAYRQAQPLTKAQEDAAKRLRERIKF